MKKFLLLLILLDSASAQASLFGKSAPEPVGIGSNGDTDKAFSALIDDGAALRHVPKPFSGNSKKVALTSIVLEFVTETGIGAQTKSFLDPSVTASSNVTYKLTGLKPETMQAVADQFSSDLRQAILARGYDVIDQETVAAITPDFAEKVKQSQTPDISKGILSDTGSTAVAARGTVFSNRMFRSLEGRNLAKALGEADIFEVRLAINFAELKNTTSFFDKFGGQNGTTFSASTSHRLQSHIVPGKSAVSISSSTSYTSYPFLRVALLPSNVSDEVVEKGMTASQAGVTLLNVFSGSSSSFKNYEASAVSDYQSVMSGDLKNVAGVIAAALEKK